MIVQKGSWPPPKFVIEEVTDPNEIARLKAQDDRACLYSKWLQAHWPDLLPAARGKFITVAGQEAFIADSAEKAWAMAKAAHPDDDGVIDQYVRPEPGPRICSLSSEASPQTDEWRGARGPGWSPRARLGRMSSMPRKQWSRPCPTSQSLSKTTSS